MVKWQDIQDMLDWHNDRRRTDTGTIATVFAAGAVLGIAAGLLLAPRSGEETRAKLRQKAKESMDRTKDKANVAKDAATDGGSQAADVGKSTAAKVRRAARQARKPSPTDDDEEERL